MSVKIRVSYQHPHELQRIIRALQPLGITYKFPKRQQGAYKRAYIEMAEDIVKRERSMNEPREKVDI